MDDDKVRLLTREIKGNTVLVVGNLAKKEATKQHARLSSLTFFLVHFGTFRVLVGTYSSETAFPEV